MIQTLLTLAVVAIILAQLYMYWHTSRKEGFIINEAVAKSKMHVSGIDTFSLLDGSGGLDTGIIYSPDDTSTNPSAYCDDEDDPRDLPWIASWSAADRFARQGHNCAIKYTKEGPDGTTIITTSKSCESGMPHTRAGNRIIIPDSIPDPLQAEIIAHELVHIYQRRYPDAWIKFYKNNWSFDFPASPPVGMPASVKEARRSNPDTFTLPWPRWRNRYWPVPVYTDPQFPSLRGAITVWWDAEDSKVMTDPPGGWTAFFGRPTQDEHPHEIAAVLIVAVDTATEAGRRLMSWWRSEGAIIKAPRNSIS